MLSLFHDTAAQLGWAPSPSSPPPPADPATANIEADIAAELAALQPAPARTPRLFTNIHLDTVCLVFIRTAPPVDPVALVLAVCDAARAASPRAWRTRWARKLTPIALTGRCGTDDEVRALCATVFAGPFRPRADGAAVTPTSFAIRPNIRNNHSWRREDLIALVASEVGTVHRVDLKNPAWVVLVEIYGGKIGVGVVSGEAYAESRKFNLAEIVAPTPVPAPRAVTAGGGEAAPAEVQNEVGEATPAGAQDESAEATPAEVSAGKVAQAAEDASRSEEPATETMKGVESAAAEESATAV